MRLDRLPRASFALGAVVAAAVARPVDDDSPSWSYTAVSAPQQPAVSYQSPQARSGGNSDLEYLLIGAGGATVAIPSFGNTAVATRRRRHGGTSRPTIAG